MKITLHGTREDRSRDDVAPMPCTIDLEDVREDTGVVRLCVRDHRGWCFASILIDRDQVATVLAEAAALGVITLIGSGEMIADAGVEIVACTAARNVERHA